MLLRAQMLGVMLRLRPSFPVLNLRLVCLMFGAAAITMVLPVGSEMAEWLTLSVISTSRASIALAS